MIRSKNKQLFLTNVISIFSNKSETKYFEMFASENVKIETTIFHYFFANINENFQTSLKKNLS